MRLGKAVASLISIKAGIEGGQGRKKRGSEPTSNSGLGGETRKEEMSIPTISITKIRGERGKSPLLSSKGNLYKVEEKSKGLLHHLHPRKKMGGILPQNRHDKRKEGEEGWEGNANREKYTYSLLQKGQKRVHFHL